MVALKAPQVEESMADQSFFTRFSHAVSATAGKPITFAVACGGILLWAISGPVFGFSETWQLIVNTSTTIITFLMVFILQNTQNRDGQAIQAKLDELILTSAAQDKFVGAENLSDKELEQLRALVTKAALSDNDAAPKSPAKRRASPRGGAKRPAPAKAASASG
jgi:low affinity Fe/Cu permease